MRSEDPNFQQKQEERCEAQKVLIQCGVQWGSVEFELCTLCKQLAISTLIRLGAVLRSKRKYKQQSDLLNRVNQETLRQGQAQDGADTKSAGRRISEIVAYKSVSEVPATKELKIEARH